MWHSNQLLILIISRCCFCNQTRKHFFMACRCSEAGNLYLSVSSITHLFSSARSPGRGSSHCTAGVGWRSESSCGSHGLPHSDGKRRSAGHDALPRRSFWLRLVNTCMQSLSQHFFNAIIPMNVSVCMLMHRNISENVPLLTKYIGGREMNFHHQSR